MSGVRDLFSPRLTTPPATGNLELDLWLRDVADEINKLPRMSSTSTTNPESTVTGAFGELLINYASGQTVAYLKVAGDGNTGWASILTGGTV